jgi:hypothetical protein
VNEPEHEHFFKRKQFEKKYPGSLVLLIFIFVLNISTAKIFVFTLLKEEKKKKWKSFSYDLAFREKSRSDNLGK